MKNVKAIIAKLLVFVMVFGVMVSSSELVRVLAEVDVVTEATPEAEEVDVVTEATPEVEEVDVVTEATPEVEEVDVVTEATPEVEEVDVVTEATPEVEEVDVVTEPTPLIPLTPVVGVQPSAHNILLNGEVIDLIAYNIGGNNFFMLRDIAYALNGTDGQFEVAWDAELNAISLTTGQPYTPVGGEMSGTAEENVVAHPTTADIFIDGDRAYLRAYNILGNNFFMLRDLGENLGFIVDWDPDTESVIIIS